MLILHEMTNAERIGLTKIWRDDNTLLRSMDVYIAKLRNKLDEDVEILIFTGKDLDLQNKSYLKGNENRF
jgi:hypothetical protein